MSIQWYPGHMTKARRAMALAVPNHDVIIEVLDARMPRASENPVVAEVRKQKPAASRSLSKSDLADPEVTKQWLRYFETERSEPTRDHPTGKVLAIAIRTDRWPRREPASPSSARSSRCIRPASARRCAR